MFILSKSTINSIKFDLKRSLTRLKNEKNLLNRFEEFPKRNDDEISLYVQVVK